MDSISATLMFGVLFGSIGFGYFMYGKKQKNTVALLAGLALMGVPYFIPNNYLLVAICTVLMFAPRFISL